jgi:hypothetical protein
MDTKPFSLMETVEEYLLLAVCLAGVAYFVFRHLKMWLDDAAFAAKVRKAEEKMRRARELQQARYEEDTAERRAELARIAEERRKQKLEEMEAASQGRTAKKKDLKKTDIRDYWDNKEYNPLNPGSGGGRGSSYKPSSCNRRRG